MLRSSVLVLTCAMALAAQAPSEEPIPKRNPHTTPADIQRGRHLFMGHCAPCHGPQGEGARGPTLARPKLPRASDDPAFFKVLRDGIPGTEMPAAWEMIDREVWQVIAYTRTLGRVEPENAPGDRARGESLYRAKGKCAQCHTIAGHGGNIGPELTEIGSRRSAAYLRAALLEPETGLPDGFLQVRLAGKDGRKLTGVRLNEDTFTIQVRDLNGRLHSFVKADLKEFQKDRGKSPMPSYKGVLSGGEIDDVVAYLVSLRGGS